MQRDFYITRYHNSILSGLSDGKRIIQMFLSKDNPLDTLQNGDIVIGKILQNVPNIQAYFVELSPGVKGFLPYSNLINPIYCNEAHNEVVVQIIKDAVKTKDPVLTTKISIPGKYCVLSASNESNKLHYSKKASDKQKRRFQEEILPELNLSHNYPYEITFRTNAFSGISALELRTELDTLSQTLSELSKYATMRTVYSKLYSQKPEWYLHLRDTYSLSFDRIVTDIPEVYRLLKPEFDEMLLFHENKSLNLLNFYKISEQFEEAMSPKVWLKSGGYLVIEQTEALTAIDVNSGKYSGKTDSETTYEKINAEAADEIAHQLRLRNISGMIIIDFINMKSKDSQEKLLKHLRDNVLSDPVLTTVIDITALGLVEVTRKKIRKSLMEQYHEISSNEKNKFREIPE